MQDFPANSAKAKATDAPREKLKPVTSAETVRRKRGLGRQFKETFFKGSAREIPGHVLEEVIVPTIRDMFHEVMHNGIDRLFYGDRSGGRPRTTSSMANSMGHVAYNRMSTSTQPKPPQPRMLSRQAKARHDFSDLVIPTAREAEEVLDRMYDLLSQGGDVSVGHLYELTGIEPSHTDMKYGWTSLRGAKVIRLRQGGYLLDLPNPEPLV